MSDPSLGVANVATPPTGPGAQATARLRATITGDDHPVTVRLRGELWGLGMSLLESVLHRVEARRPPLVILDTRELTVIDRSGAGLVRRAKERARLAGPPLQEDPAVRRARDQAEDMSTSEDGLREAAIRGHRHVITLDLRNEAVSPTRWSMGVPLGAWP